MPQKITKSKKKTIRQRKERADKIRDTLAYVRAAEAQVDNAVYQAEAAQDEELFVVDKPKIISLKNVTQKLVNERRAEKKKKFKDGLTKELEIWKEKAMTRPVVRPNSTHEHENKNENRHIRELAIKIKAEQKRKESQSDDEEITDEPKSDGKSKLLSFWDAPSKSKGKKRGKPIVPVPHAGQSYNPAKEAHRQTLNMAFKGEKKLLDKFDDIENNVRSLLAEDTGEGGDDIIDGLRIHMKPVEEQPCDEIEYPPSFVPRKKKLTKTKLKNLKKHLKELKRRNAKIAKKTEVEPREILQKIEARLQRRNEERDIRKKRKAEKIKAKALELIQPVNDAKDILLEEELPGRLNSMDGNSFYLWQERLRSYHNSKLVTVPSLRKGNIRVGNTVVA